MTRREKVLAYGSWLAVCVFWGTTYLAIRVGLETMPPMLFAGLRFLLAGVLLLGFVRLRGERLPRGREWADLSVVGLMLLGVGTGVVVWAEQWVSSGMTALLVAGAPFWMAGLEWRQKGGERVGRKALAGMIVGFAGLALLVGPELFGVELDARYWLGVVALQVGCASWSAGTVYAKHHRTEVRPLMGAAVQMLAAGAALTLVGTAAGEWPALHFNPRTLAAFLYLLVFGSLVAYSAYTYAIRKLPLSLVSTYSYVNPVIAVLLGWLLLGEPLGLRVLAAMCVILCGVAFVKGAATPAPAEGVGAATAGRDDRTDAPIAGNAASAGAK